MKLDAEVAVVEHRVPAAVAAVDERLRDVVADESGALYPGAASRTFHHEHPFTCANEQRRHGHGYIRFVEY
jgi:hypothetical protein